MNVIAFDTETFLIGPEAIAPKMVCVSFSLDTFDDLVGNGDEGVLEDLRTLFELGHILVGHNVAYDCAVVAKSYPELESMIWAKYAAGEIICTKIQEQLINLGTHGKLDMIKLPDGSSKKLQYYLTTLEQKYLGINRSAEKDGDDVWRLNYNLLDGRRAADYPPEASGYAIDDSRGTLGVYNEQVRRAPAGVLGVAPFHAWADFALFMITTKGMAIDPSEVMRVREQLQADLAPEKLQPLVDCGILRPGNGPRPHARSLKRCLELLGKEPTEKIEDWSSYQDFLEGEAIPFTKAVAPSVNRAALVAVVTSVCNEHGIELKLTPTEKVSTDSEVLDDLYQLNDILSIYRDRQVLQKLVTTELPRMEWEGEIADVVHFPFRALLETGRTSSFANRLYPSGNGQQIHPKVRPCYKARDGHVLLSTDYGTLELATVGQKMVDLFGHSVHADKINAGQDVHSFLGARLAFELSKDFRVTCDEQELTSNDQIYEGFMALKDHKDQNLADFYDWWRGFSKPTGLGYPGGLGPWTFLGFAKKSYGVNIAEIAGTLPDDSFEMSEYLLKLAKEKLGMQPADFEWNGQTKAIALAIKLKEIWLDTFQMRPYYKHISENMKDPENPVIGMTPKGRPIQGYTYTSDFGMVRRGCSYTSCCNGYAMQTPGAEGAKTAVILVTRACRDKSMGSILYGDAHPVDFIHDELLTEHKEISVQQLHDHAEEVSSLMFQAMEGVLPDVPGIKREGVLMRAWRKKIKPTFDDQGRLIVTEMAKILD